LRSRPLSPLAQKAQRTAHPTWLEMQSVWRSLSGMETDSRIWPSSRRVRIPSVPSALACVRSSAPRRTRQRVASSARSARDRSVIASKEDTPRASTQRRTSPGVKRRAPGSSASTSQPASGRSVSAGSSGAGASPGCADDAG